MRVLLLAFHTPKDDVSDSMDFSRFLLKVALPSSNMCGHRVNLSRG